MLELSPVASAKTGHNPTTYPQTLNQGVCHCVACHRCQGCCQRADIIVLLPSRIQEDFWRVTIIIVKEVAPPNWRRLLTHQYCSLATVIEEVAAQSCHHSLATVKNLRRLPTHCYCHCQGGRATKSKEIADAPTLQSCHCCWGGFCTVLSAQSHHCQEFKESKR